LKIERRLIVNTLGKENNMITTNNPNHPDLLKIDSGMIYLGSSFASGLMSATRIPKRCKYCQKEITRRSIVENQKKGKYKKEDEGKYNVDLYKAGYCCMWEYEIENPPKHKCHKCKVSVEPFKNKLCNNSGVYPKYCPECRIERKKEYLERKRISAKKKYDKNKLEKLKLIGHTCKRCNTFKTWDNFYKDSYSTIGYLYTCKECCNETRKEYYYRNQEKEKARGRDNYNKALQHKG